MVPLLFAQEEEEEEEESDEGEDESSADEEGEEEGEEGAPMDADGQQVRRRVAAARPRCRRLSAAPQVWRPGVDGMGEDEELDYDPSAYDCLHSFQLEWPCLRRA